MKLNDNAHIEKYLNKHELAELLNCSVRTIERHSQHIVGYIKIGSLARFHASTVYRNLLAGKNLFGKSNELRAKRNKHRSHYK